MPERFAFNINISYSLSLVARLPIDVCVIAISLKPLAGQMICPFQYSKFSIIEALSQPLTSCTEHVYAHWRALPLYHDLPLFWRGDEMSRHFLLWALTVEHRQSTATASRAIISSSLPGSPVSYFLSFSFRRRLNLSGTVSSNCFIFLLSDLTQL